MKSDAPKQVMYDQDGLRVEITGPTRLPLVEVTVSNNWADAQSILLTPAQAQQLCDELLLLLIPGATRAPK